jgi:hypothetical protein
MKSSVTKAFRNRLSELPKSVQEQAVKSFSLWKEEPYHASLQFKRVSQRKLIYSVRISLNYRALGLLESDHIYLSSARGHPIYRAVNGSRNYTLHTE